MTDLQSASLRSRLTYTLDSAPGATSQRRPASPQEALRINGPVTRMYPHRDTAIFGTEYAYCLPQMFP